MSTTVKKQPRREKTEEAILDAFERVLLRDGAHKISVMSISREGDVAKTLIYKYFDGLVGLIKTWVERRKIWPDLTEIFAADDIVNYNDNPLLFQKQNLIRLADYLRNNPLLLELLTAELLESGPVSEALAELREERTQEETRFLGQDLKTADIQGRPTLRIFNAAIYYLVLRARTAPDYMGTVQLDTDEGWAAVMADLEEIFDDLIAYQSYISIAEERQKKRKRNT